MRIDGALVGAKKKQIYIALNKPAGITSTTEPHVKGNILELIDHGERIFPIGRLDKDSEGLILLTNDGDVVNEILRAENNHEKEYIVTVNRPITDLALGMMASGVKIMGDMTKPCKVTRIDGHISHHSHSRAESADPPHVLGARLQDAATAAGPIIDIRLGTLARRVALPDRIRSGRSCAPPSGRPAWRGRSRAVRLLLARAQHGRRHAFDHWRPTAVRHRDPEPWPRASGRNPHLDWSSRRG